MGNIIKRIDKSKQRTTFVATGELKTGELLEAINDFYHAGVTLDVLWDLTDVDLKNITSEAIREFTKTPPEGEALRRGGKTALVVSSTSAFGLSRMYQLQKEIVEHAFETMVFKSMEDALKWLDNS